MEQNLLKNAELKATKKRKLLLSLLKKHKHPVTAEELYEEANLIMPINVSTVYRTLNTLTEKNIIERTVRQDGKAYYILPQHEHHHRLVCSCCGKTIPVHNCPLIELEEMLEEETGFHITGHSLEFTGLCPQCAEKHAAENKNEE